MRGAREEWGGVDIFLGNMTLSNNVTQKKRSRVIKEIAKWRYTHMYTRVYMYVNKILNCKTKMKYFYLFSTSAGRH